MTVVVFLEAVGRPEDNDPFLSVCRELGFRDSRPIPFLMTFIKNSCKFMIQSLITESEVVIRETAIRNRVNLRQAPAACNTVTQSDQILIGRGSGSIFSGEHGFP